MKEELEEDLTKVKQEKEQQLQKFWRNLREMLLVLVVLGQQISLLQTGELDKGLIVLSIMLFLVFLVRAIMAVAMLF